MCVYFFACVYFFVRVYFFARVYISVSLSKSSISAEPTPVIQREAFINAPRSPVSESVSTVKISWFELSVLYEIKLKKSLLSLNAPGIKGVKVHVVKCESTCKRCETELGGVNFLEKV